MRFGNRRKLLYAALLVAVLLASLPALALAEDPLDARAREIASSLSCPICAGLTVADSGSTLAQQMRALILKKLKAGESRQQILDYFVDRYGESILLEPPRQGFNLGLWWLPFLGLAAGTVFLSVAIYRWVARRPATASSTSSIPDDLSAYERRLDDELEDRLRHG